MTNTEKQKGRPVQTDDGTLEWIERLRYSGLLAYASKHGAQVKFLLDMNVEISVPGLASPLTIAVAEDSNGGFVLRCDLSEHIRHFAPSSGIHEMDAWDRCTLNEDDAYHCAVDWPLISSQSEEEVEQAFEEFTSLLHLMAEIRRENLSESAPAA